VRRREEQRCARELGKPYHPPLDHPLLEEPLAETLGVILYQDQVLQVCRSLAGFSPGQAEALRRAMSRRRSRRLLEGFWEEVRDGALARGVREPIAQRVFEQVTAFSEFGFPKSHAAAFGLLAYQSAWLRHYYPVEYYTALFNNQPMGFYSLDALVRDAKRHGIDVELPDVDKSDVYCTVEGSSLRIGLGFIRNVGWDVAEALVVERERHGAFLSLSDVVRRAPPALSRDGIENMVWVGACDGFGLTRRELLWQVGLWLPPKTDASTRRVRRQLELPLTHPYERIHLGDVAPDERLVAEYQMLGFAASGHPLSLVEDALPPHVRRSDSLPQLDTGTQVEVAGLVVARQRPQTAHGYVFILMEDEAGMINAIVRPEVYERDRMAVRGESLLWVRGKLAKDDGTINVIAEEIQPLKLRQATPTVRSNPSPYKFLKQLRRHPPAVKSWG
jgi:error-prone DNA polymerase